MTGLSLPGHRSDHIHAALIIVRSPQFPCRLKWQVEPPEAYLLLDSDRSWIACGGLENELPHAEPLQQVATDDAHAFVADEPQ